VEEKELPLLPNGGRPYAFYERQINGLREELNTVETEIDTHLEALEVAEDWHKRQKQELLDRIKQLEAEVEKLKKQLPKN
jgi:predicted  nucleic acid-binding Zn-ribbon protein